MRQLSRIDRFSLGSNEEVLRGGVTVLEGAGIPARGTGSCTQLTRESIVNLDCIEQVRDVPCNPDRLLDCTNAVD